MHRYRLSPYAESDIEAILAWSETQFGEKSRLRYEALLVQAIQDVANDPLRPGCIARPELSHGAFTYHLQFSRDRIDSHSDRVRKPRHLILFRLDDTGCLEIARVLHDSMELWRHLPPDL